MARELRRYRRCGVRAFDVRCDNYSRAQFLADRGDGKLAVGIGPASSAEIAANSFLVATATSPPRALHLPPSLGESVKRQSLAALFSANFLVGNGHHLC